MTQSNITKGQEVEITIEDMSNEGQGIGKSNGFVIFVPGTIVGDKVRVELTKVKKNYAFGKKIEILNESSYVNDDFDCQAFANGCGGCPYGRINYEQALKIKEKQIREKLIRIAEIEEPNMLPIIGMKEEDNEGSGAFRYRNKAHFPISTGGIITRKGGIVENLGEPAIGFYKAKTHEVVDCEDCYLQALPAIAVADALKIFMKEDNITAWDPRWEKGLMRSLTVKTSFANKDVMVIIETSTKGIPNVSKMIEMLDDAVESVNYFLESVIMKVRKAGEQKEENIVIAGSQVIKDKIGDLEFEISADSFYQVNPVQTKRLYDKVKEYCCRDIEGKTKKSNILDLYCGVGTIGLYCADEAGQILGIESEKVAVLDANRNAVINGVVNARYITGNVEEILTDSKDEDIDRIVKAADIAIIDPPRAGCRREVLDVISKAGIDKVVYVSCDPGTLARDIKILNESGYKFIEATPVDMFPCTSHVETIVLMSRVKE